MTSEGTTTHTCSATAGDHTVSLSVTIRIDKTLPTVPAGTAARSPDSNGWYNHAVSVGFTATDAVSGLDFCTGGNYGGPDSASGSVPGSCTDRAGNTSSGSFSLAYDSTGPTPTAVPSRSPNGNGWYRSPLTISFAQAPGDLSGPGSCTAPVDYGGPDSAAASVSGSCTDLAGNPSSSLAHTFKYDSAAPSALAAADRPPNANGWYRSSVRISFTQGAGDLSGPDTCSAPVDYAGPDNGSVTRSGTCTDKAGNTSAPGGLTFRYDATAPTASGALARPPNGNGWYRAPVALDVTGTDALSGIASCSGPTYSGPDGASRTVSGSCTDRAGNITPATATLNYDATAPNALAATSRAPNGNGWYNAPLTVSFSQAAGDTSGPDSCTAAVPYAGPDTASVSIPGTCTDKAGNTSAPAAATVKYDATPPTALAAADRAPNSNGWYRAPVTISFTQAAGDLSGADTCSAAVGYSSPDAASVTRSGACTDKAGNTSAPASLTFKYDATAPGASASLARAADRNGWYNRPVGLNVSGTDATSGVDACTSPTYSGPDGASRTVSGTCSDRAGNTSTPASATLAYDATAPTAVAAASRAPNAAGWYNAPLTISFTQAAGDVSGPDTCAVASGYSGPDDATASRSGSCTDRAGNTSTPASLTFKYDATAPSANGGLDRLPDANGWYNHPVALGVTGSDATSGIASCSGPTYSGPDGPDRTISGSCTDRAGNTNNSVSATFKYDSTAPTASGSLARGPDLNGWYNRPVLLDLTGADATSGIASCSGGYAGPDGTSKTASGTCVDVAGNPSGLVTATVNYDATPPVATAALARGPDANGWYNQPVDVAVTGSDATSGLAGCAGARYSGPDGAAQNVGGSCTDRAGNTAAPQLTLRYDATPPATTAVPDRDAGWYREPVTVTFGGADGASGIVSCTVPATYSGPDTAGVSLSGSCTDAAGNTGGAAFTVKFDATAPGVSAGLSRAPDANGWFNSPVSLVASGSDATSGIASCTQPSYAGPDTAGVTLGASCRDNAGNGSGGVSASLRYDATPPAVTAAPDRMPDAGGWYRRALTVSFAGADATSGIESCTAPVRYSGPDRTNGSVDGTCRDHAGNTAEAAHVFRYDATAPVVRNAAVKVVKGVARLTWQRSADAVSVEVVRTPGRAGARPTRVYRGSGSSFADATVRNGVRYRWEITTADVAGNVASTAVAATVRPVLYQPAAGAVVRAPVRIAWETVEGARFYNLQLLRDGAKILSTWPVKPRFLLQGRWTYAGQSHRLEPGVYVVWVWAARGTRAKPGYGRPLGSIRFVVKR